MGKNRLTAATPHFVRQTVAVLTPIFTTFFTKKNYECGGFSQDIRFCFKSKNMQKMGSFLPECERYIAKSPCYQAVFPSGNKFAMICKGCQLPQKSDRI